MTHDMHPHGCSPHESHTTYGDNFGLAGCTTEEVREEELPRRLFRGGPITTDKLEPFTELLIDPMYSRHA